VRSSHTFWKLHIDHFFFVKAHWRNLRSLCHGNFKLWNLLTDTPVFLLIDFTEILTRILSVGHLRLNNIYYGISYWRVKLVKDFTWESKYVMSCFQYYFLLVEIVHYFEVMHILLLWYYHVISLNLVSFKWCLPQWGQLMGGNFFSLFLLPQNFRFWKTPFLGDSFTENPFLVLLSKT